MGPVPIRANVPRVAAPIKIEPGERLYTIEELIQLHFTIPVYDEQGNFRMWKRMFGTAGAARKRFISRYLSETREPGKIWARRIGGVWLIPERSFFEFMRGEAADEQCPMCGGRLASLLQGDGDLLLRIKSRLQTAEAAERRAIAEQAEARKQQEKIERELEQMADPNNPTYKFFGTENEEPEMTTQGNAMDY